MKKILLSCFLLVTTSVNVLFGQQITLSSKVITTPVLADQDINVLRKIQISSNEDLSNQKLEIAYNLDATAMKSIQTIEIWESIKDTSLLKSSNKTNYKRLVELKAKKGQNAIKFNVDLKSGINTFWLSIRANPAEQLTEEFNIKQNYVRLNGKRTIFKGQDISSHRLAVAVRRHKQDNVHTSRIPGIITAKDGSLVSIYDARYESGRDLQGHMDIAVSRSLDKGLTWLPMEIAMDMKEFGGLPEKFNGVSDANILLDENTGDIYIAGLWMYGVIDEKGTWYPGIKDGKEIWNHQWKTKGSQPGFGIKETSQFLIVKSSDNGKSWSEPINLTEMCKQEDWWLWAPAPGHGITLKDGTLVIPTQGRLNNGKAFSNITYSKDAGKTWKTSKPALDRSTTECMAVELEDGSIMLNMRSNLNTTQKGDDNGRAIATTSDLGNTWTEHPTSHNALIEPTCMASIHRHHYIENGEKKTMLVFCNPNSKYDRVNITLKVSKDNGKTWQTKVLLDEGKSRGYSCITSVDENTVGVLYESSQADLVFQQVSIKDLL
ncbi:exo-alpha-sialidase [Sphingobacterium kyonggiense]|uniref:exo-alpha-sialidase n=1 Tax=Sphingobacterium kyonggiense TaxID=714075 RepID=A0ABP7Z2R5_9SPHI